MTGGARGGRRLLALCLAGASVAWPGGAGAQQAGALPAARAAVPGDSARAGVRGDTTRRRPVAAPGDTGRKAELVQWEPTDSVMDALIARKGFHVTRYQGNRVLFDATRRDLRLSGRPAAVNRVRTLLVGDTVTYNDSTQMVFARGDTVKLRDPDANNEDVVARGGLRYDISEGRGVAEGLETKVDNKGSKWVVFGHQAALVAREDTTVTDTLERKKQVFYASGGTITSCQDTTPHYHFSAGEMKVVSGGMMVARPAVLYIADIPVAWFPFIFQDMRQGRRSGMLVPRFGFSELVRNSSTYQRMVENLGYYFALSDYMDATVAMDYRSGTRPPAGGYGFTRVNGEWRYRWLSRFMTGGIGLGYLRQTDDATTLNAHWNHQQSFSQTSNLNVNVNYVSNTTVQRNTTINPTATLASIRSDANYTRRVGPLSLAIGGSQSQYPGRSQVDRTFPSLSISSEPIALASWLTWTPGFSLRSQQTLALDLAGEFGYRYRTTPTGAIDSVKVRQNTTDLAMGFQTPLKIGNWDLRLGFDFSDRALDYPQSRRIVNVRDTSIKETRIFARTFRSDLDWNLGFALPSIAQGSWNIAPSVSLQNVAPGAYLVRTELSGGSWVAQGKKLVYGLGMSPTFFALYNGFGPVGRIRHALQPVLSYSYAPAADVADDYLAATGNTRVGYLGSLAQSALSLQLNQNFEAKIRTAGDTGEGRKVRLLSINLSPFSYNFEQLKEVRRIRAAAGKPAPSWTAGLTTQNVSANFASELLPNFSLSVQWSLFQGSVISDTAVFEPVPETIQAGLQLDRNSPIIGMFRRLLGLKAADTATTRGAADASTAGRPPGYTPSLAAGTSPIGGAIRPQQFEIPSGQGWRLSLSFSSTKTRTPVGGNVKKLDPTVVCLPLRTLDTRLYDNCLLDPSSQAPLNPQQNTTNGGVVFVTPAVTNIQFQYSFNLTPKWAAQWSSSYDVEKNLFASQVISLQRDMHDWRATFAFTASPNGNASFSFFISLKAEPEIKFDYNRSTLANPTGR